MSMPGSDLSQPASVTEPSRRSANITVSTLSAMTSRETSEARMPSWPIEMPSETEMVPNSIGKPPAARTPSLAACARRCSERLQGVISFQEDATPICGFDMSSSVMPTARSIARAGARCMPSVTSVLRGLRCAGPVLTRSRVGEQRPRVPGVQESTVTSSDGTVLRTWASGGEGLPLLLCNGLGAIPEAWPALVAPDSGYAVATWYHRGTFGSQRPADLRRVRVEDHVEDAVAVLDAAGVERALVAGWSIGVNVAFELAQRHPDRVAGLLAVAGVPGGTFATMGGPLRLPRPLRRPLATRTAKAARAVGPALTWLAPRVPVDRRTAWLVGRSGFMLPGADPDLLAAMLREFVQQDWRWYFTLAVAASEHRPMDLSFVQCPVTLLAGRHDVLTSMHDVIDAAARIPHAQTTVLPGSHFLPLERSDLVHAALDELARRSDLAP